MLDASGAASQPAQDTGDYQFYKMTTPQKGTAQLLRAERRGDADAETIVVDFRLRRWTKYMSSLDSMQHVQHGPNRRRNTFHRAVRFSMQRRCRPREGFHRRSSNGAGGASVVLLPSRRGAELHDDADQHLVRTVRLCRDCVLH